MYNNMDLSTQSECNRLMSEQKIRLSMSKAPGEYGQGLSNKALGRLGCCGGTNDDNNDLCILF